MDIEAGQVLRTQNKIEVKIKQILDHILMLADALPNACLAVTFMELRCVYIVVRGRSCWHIVKDVR